MGNVLKLRVQISGDGVGRKRVLNREALGRRRDREGGVMRNSRNVQDLGCFEFSSYERVHGLGNGAPWSRVQVPNSSVFNSCAIGSEIVKIFFFSTWMNNSACSPTGMAMYVCARFSIQSSKLKILFFLNICLNKTQTHGSFIRNNPGLGENRVEKIHLEAIHLRAVCRVLVKGRGMGTAAVSSQKLLLFTCIHPIHTQGRL